MPGRFFSAEDRNRREEAVAVITVGLFQMLVARGHLRATESLVPAPVPVFISGLRLIKFEFSALEISFIQSLDSGVCFAIVTHFDEAKAF